MSRGISVQYQTLASFYPSATPINHPPYHPSLPVRLCRDNGLLYSVASDKLFINLIFYHWTGQSFFESWCTYLWSSGQEYETLKNNIGFYNINFHGNTTIYLTESKTDLTPHIDILAHWVLKIKVKSFNIMILLPDITILEQNTRICIYNLIINFLNWKICIAPFLVKKPPQWRCTDVCVLFCKVLSFYQVCIDNLV